MKRECTEVENSIIKKSGGDILTHPHTYLAMFRNSGVPITIGAILGMGLCAMILLMFAVTEEKWAWIILGICVSITVEFFVLIWKLYNRSKMHRTQLPGDKFWVNGGTVIKYLNTKEGDFFFCRR